MGSGRFVGPKTIEVALNDGGVRALTGAEVVLNLGSHAAVPDIPGLEAARPLTHIEALELDYLPSHLIVLGGGYVGIETAQTFRRFGSRVTIVEPGRQLMGREDPDVAQEIETILSGEGVEVVLNARSPARAVPGPSGDAVAVTARTEPTESGRSKAAICSSRSAGSRTPPISVSTKPGSNWTRAASSGSTSAFRRARRASGRSASAPAARSSPMCRSTTSGSSRDNMAGGNRRTNDRQVPYVMFTDPPLARVGLSEAEARRQGVPVRVAQLPMSQVLRTEATDEKAGLHEGARQRERRSHPGLHHDRLRGWRGPGGGPDRDDGGASVPEASRRRFLAPDHGRRPRSAVCDRFGADRTSTRNCAERSA